MFVVGSVLFYPDVEPHSHDSEYLGAVLYITGSFLFLADDIVALNRVCKKHCSKFPGRFPTRPYRRYTRNFLEGLTPTLTLNPNLGPYPSPNPDSNLNSNKDTKEIDIDVDLQKCFCFLPLLSLLIWASSRAASSSCPNITTMPVFFYL